MRSRLLILVVAIALGLLAAVLTGRYLATLERGVAAEDEPIEVLVAQEALERGAAADQLIADGLIVRESIPRRYVADGAVSAVAAIEGKVLAEHISKGEQITEVRFKFPAEAGLAHGIPEDHVAVSIPNNAVKGVAGLVKPGDFVMAVVTFDPGPEGEAVSRVLLPKARVLAIGAAVGTEPEPAAGEGGVLGGQTGRAAEPVAPSTITLALPPADVERLVFAEEKGAVWLALIGSATAEVPATQGQTLRSVLVR